MLKPITYIFSFLPLLSLAATVQAGDTSSGNQNGEVKALGDITVEATRVNESLYEIPASVGSVDKDAVQFGKEQLGLDESLNQVPGIFMQNRYNINQDLSISIRGFGLADFGVRGVRVYVDGIPNTLADGQSNIDAIDLGSVGRIDVLRGPSSSLYGVSSGGVINIYTEEPTPEPFIEGRATVGSYNFSQLQLKAGGQRENVDYLVSAQRMNYDGFRRHSHGEKTLINSKFRWNIDETSDLTLTANILDKPIAEDPGALDRASFDADPESVRANNINFDAEETVDQQQIGLVFNKQFNPHHETTLRHYYIFREFDNKLPFPNAVAFDRFFVGGGAQHTYTDTLFGHGNRLTFGFDIDSQMDVRKNFGNALGDVGGLSFNQDEDVFSWGVYAQNTFDITDTLHLRFGGRYDKVEYDFTDNFLSDGNDSGSTEFDEISPQVGLLWEAHEAVNLYGTISRSFETPTTSEFATPDGSGGLNSDLDAQVATNYEIGVKGVLPGRASYQISLFHIDTENELVLVGENPNGNDYFTSVASSDRNGVEAAVTFQPIPGLDVILSYTYSDFEYDKYPLFDDLGNVIGNFDGNTIPGQPEHFGYAEIAYYHPSGFYGSFNLQAVDEIITDDGNSDAADGYVIGNMRAGYTAYMGGTEIQPFIGVNNIWDEDYVGKVRINATGGRYFEAGTPVNVFAGISITYR